MLREISIRVVIQYSINGRFSSDRYQKVARPLTGSMGFGFIFQSPDTLPDIKKCHFLLIFLLFWLPSTPYCYLNILNSSALWVEIILLYHGLLEKKSIKLTMHKNSDNPWGRIWIYPGFTFTNNIKLYVLLNWILY